MGGFAVCCLAAAKEKRLKGSLRLGKKRRARRLEVVPQMLGAWRAEEKVPPSGDVLCLAARKMVSSLEVVPGLQMAAKKVHATAAALQLVTKQVALERASWNQKGV